MRGRRTRTKVFTRSASQKNAFFLTSGCSSDPTCSESTMTSRVPLVALDSFAVPPSLSRQAILTVKAEHVATFLGHKITAQLAQEIGSQFATRIEGTCVKHRFGKSSIKIYDKFGLVLRIETTTNDVAAFKHYRKVEHRQGPATRALAPSERPSTASRTCVRSCSAAIAATSNTSPVW